MDWYVVTPENIDEIWNKLKEQEKTLVLFALTDDGYEQLSLTIAEVRNIINSQRVILLKYREYYEPQEVKETKQQ
jgi:chemotaxis signal transduction protein